MKKVDFDYNKTYNHIYDMVKENNKGETEEFYKNTTKKELKNTKEIL